MPQEPYLQIQYWLCYMLGGYFDNAGGLLVNKNCKMGWQQLGFSWIRDNRERAFNYEIQRYYLWPEEIYQFILMVI